MTDISPSAADVKGGHPLHPALVPFPFVCFVGALATDIAYWRTASVQWETFSVWLLAAGLIMAAAAFVLLLIDLLRPRANGRFRPAWLRILCCVVAVVLAVINAFVHSRDGYTAVVPTGLALSAVVVLILIFTVWPRWLMVQRYRVGAAI